MTLGDHIQAKRFEKGLNQSELAQKLGLTCLLVGHWEADRQKPTEAEWRALADVLNLRNEI